MIQEIITGNYIGGGANQEGGNSFGKHFTPMGGGG